MNTLMVQGTTSDAGKSTLVAALCRIFSDAGHRVAPFKPQNMALNSAVTEDGGEIGRAQALQAIAARVPAHTDFNPVLLKPNSDTGAQVILQGRAISNMEAAQYHDYKQVAMDAVLDSHQRLSKHYDYVLVEGAGSPAEINLRQGDIANMGFAEATDCPVILIADIDKGGVFAHLVGTLALLSESEQARVKGFVINRFRGDMALLQSGLDWLEQRTNKPVLGVLPYMHDLALDAEDAVDNQNITEQIQARIAVLLLPHTSNHTDFDALRQHSQIELTYVRMGQSIPACELVIIPGSKNVIFDLQFVYQQDWQQQIKRHVRYGGKVLGICGGMQMLGEYIDDPHQVESSCPHIDGLGLADFGTELAPQKVVKEVTIDLATGTAKGYEIHCGQSQGSAFSKALWQVKDTSGSHNEGFISADGQIIGTYVHGLFDTDAGNQWLLQWLDASQPWQRFDLNEHREQQLTQLAKVFAQHLDMEKIKKILEPTHG